MMTAGTEFTDGERAVWVHAGEKLLRASAVDGEHLLGIAGHDPGGERDDAACHCYCDVSGGCAGSGLVEDESAGMGEGGWAGCGGGEIVLYEVDRVEVVGEHEVYCSCSVT